MIVLVALATWLFFQTSPASSQVSGGEGTKVGRYVYVSGGLATVIMIDTQTGKTSALSAPGMFGGRDEPGEFAWVPITKFEDAPSYRKWLQQRRQEMYGPRYHPTATPSPNYPAALTPSPTGFRPTTKPSATFRPTAPPKPT